MGVAEIIGALLSIIDKVMDKLPSYEQAKRNRYHKLKEEYYEELQKIPGERNAARITELYYELVRFANDFAKELWR